MAMELGLGFLLVSAAAVQMARGHGDGGGGLSYDYYKEICPGVESIVRSALLPVFLSDFTTPAPLLRLFFHDCQVQGCDASILLDIAGGEMESEKNFGIRKREAVGFAKAEVEAACPGVVSCADVLVLAAREAVSYYGGPDIAVPLGRKDSMSASRRRADAMLPSAYAGADVVLPLLLSKGMSVEESVAILGAHTIGVGHCPSIVGRIYRGVRGGENMDPAYRAFLMAKCPDWSISEAANNETFVFNDATLLKFDNQYYRDIRDGRGLFVVDADISIDHRTAPIVGRFAEDQESFFRAFAAAFVKLSSAEVIAGGDATGGEVRRVCNKPNYYYY